MEQELPKIIQGGMGVAVSNWRLAQAVSRLGQLGVVSGTALDLVVARRLQSGDPGGHVRRALQHFAFPKMAQRVLNDYFIPGGKKLGAPFKAIAKPLLKGTRAFNELCIVANFVEVFLAREGHNNAVGINYLEKIQLPHLPSLYGALLAGVAYVIVGAGIAIEMPGAIEALAAHEAASYSVRVQGAAAAARVDFNPANYHEDGDCLPRLARPRFLPVVSAEALATMFLRRTSGRIDGFVVETAAAGGHNAPPRGAAHFTDDGQPVYGAKDMVNLAAMRALGIPFWLAGGYGTPARVRHALAEGAAGVQVGTAFALCSDSGMLPELRRAMVRRALAGNGRVFTDPRASPTGFPFKVAQLPGSLADDEVYRKRPRVCDLGYLREPYQCSDGTIGYRCPAEPLPAFVAKGGDAAAAAGRKCVCNGLLASVGLADQRCWGNEPPLLTLGDSFAGFAQFCGAGRMELSAAEVIDILLSETGVEACKA